MQRAILSVAVMLIATVGNVSPRLSAADPTATLKIGMVQGMFRDVQPAMVQALSRPLRDILTRQTGLDGNVDICSDAFVLADRMTNKQLQLGVFHGFEFAWVTKQHPDLVPLLITVPAGRKVGACVVVHKDSECKTLADLKDENVIIPRGAKAHTLLYLDRERTGLESSTAKPKTQKSQTSEDALDAVVIGDSAATLVDAAALSGYQTLQPGAFKQLRVLCESESFPPAVIAYRKGALDESTVAKVKESLNTAHQTVVGKPLMAMWNLRGFEDVPADYPQKLESIRKAYPAPKSTDGK